MLAFVGVHIGEKNKISTRQAPLWSEKILFNLANFLTNNNFGANRYLFTEQKRGGHVCCNT